jgi:hypothetical protein
MRSQHCRICHEGASSTGRQHSQQSKPHGQTRLCSRGTSPKDFPSHRGTTDIFNQDREAEPRFTGPPSGGRGGYDGPPGRGGYGGGFGGGMGAGGGGRQIYVSNVCCIHPFPLKLFLDICVDLRLLASLHRRLAGFEGPLPSSW